MPPPKMLFLLIITVPVLFGCSPPAADSPEQSNSDAISLDWKLADDEVVIYTTAMEQITEADTQFNFDPLDTLPAETGDNIPSLNELLTLATLNMPQSASFVSVLEKNERGNISVEMRLGQMTFDDTNISEASDVVDGDMLELQQTLREYREQMSGTVQLAGELHPDGSIASFYLEQRQRNLLALMFELPSVPVQVGDIWELDVNCISLGTGFIADHAEKMNRVQLTEITQNEAGEALAVIDYMVIEAVAGTMGGAFMDEAPDTSMTCSFLGRGYFLIDQGRWQQLNGEFKVTSTGVMTTSSAQHIALMPVETLPEDFQTQP